MTVWRAHDGSGGDDGWNPNADKNTRQAYHEELYANDAGDTPFHRHRISLEKYMSHYVDKSRKYAVAKNKERDENRRVPQGAQTENTERDEDQHVPQDQGTTTAAPFQTKKNGKLMTLFTLIYITTVEVFPYSFASLLDTATHGDEDGTEKASYHDEEHAGIITIPTIAVHYRKKNHYGNNVTRGSMTMLMPSGWDRSSEIDGPLSLSEEGTDMVTSVTTRTLFNAQALYSGNKILKKIYAPNQDGSDHLAVTAFEDTAKNFLLPNGDIKPWKSSIPLPIPFSNISTIDGLKDAEAGQPEVS